MVRGIVRDKFKNNRKRVVGEAKKKRGVGETDETEAAANFKSQTKRKRGIVGLVNYCPPVEGETDEMIQMINRMKVANPGLKEDLMDKTFAWRRHLVVVESRTVRAILDLFPSLGHADQVFFMFIAPKGAVSVCVLGVLGRFSN